MCLFYLNVFRSRLVGRYPIAKMTTSWEEVKLLAADFQRAQLTSSVQRLSDRNCIEIVKKLISMKLIDVVFTTSGKEYITPQHLHKEIKVRPHCELKNPFLLMYIMQSTRTSDSSLSAEVIPDSLE